MFFFSSRSRHTRSLRDWSSDVCSSDLRRLRRPRDRAGQRTSPHLFVQLREFARDRNRSPRSEERRVGKECSARGAPYWYKQKLLTERSVKDAIPLEGDFCVAYNADGTR